MEWIVAQYAVLKNCGVRQAWEEVNARTIFNFVPFKDFLWSGILSEPEVIDYIGETGKCNELVAFFNEVFFPSNIAQCLTKKDVEIFKHRKGKYAHANLVYFGFPNSTTIMLEDFENPEQREANMDLLQKDPISWHLMYDKIAYFSDFFDILVSRESPENICNRLANHLKVNNPNLHSLFKYMQTSHSMPCRSDVIKSFGPTIAQVYFADPSSFSDSLVKGKQDWSDFLPEWRCSHISETGQCEKFARRNGETCESHITSRKRKKPVFQSSGNITADDYELNPTFQNQLQPYRYPVTLRPVSDMHNLKSSLQPLEEWYLPIVRYEKLYYSQESSLRTYCGKFLFYEPQSQHAIAGMQRAAIFATKVHAYITLFQTCPNPQPQIARFPKLNAVKERVKAWCKEDNFELLKQLFADGISTADWLLSMILDYFDGIFASASMANAFSNVTEFANFLNYRFRKRFNNLEELNNDWHNVGFPLFFPSQQPSGNDFDPNFYKGVLDFLDQPICNMARDQGLEIVILQHEIGSHDCVSEVLYTGDNLPSIIFDFPNIELESDIRRGALAKIWFPETDGLISFGEDQPFHLPVRLDMFYDIPEPVFIRAPAKPIPVTDEIVQPGNVAWRREYKFREPVDEKFY